MVENLAAGTYTVTVTNQADCSETITVTVAAPDSISLTTSLENPSCGGIADGRITIVAEGGSGNYQYDFGGSGLQEESFVDDFPIGTYELVVIDANNCQQTAEVILAEKELETNPATITEPTCFGEANGALGIFCLLYTSPSPRDLSTSRMPSSA